MSSKYERLIIWIGLIWCGVFFVWDTYMALTAEGWLRLLYAACAVLMVVLFISINANRKDINRYDAEIEEIDRQITAIKAKYERTFGEDFPDISNDRNP